MAKRRTRGDGGLYQRHDHPGCPPLINGERAAHKCQGRWVGNIVVRIDGKVRRKSVYGRTQKEARIKLAAALREKSDGTLVVASMTTGAWLNYWLDNIADVRPQTRRGYRSKLDRYLIPQLGKIRLTDLRPEHIRAMHKKMRTDGLAEASVRQTHAILRRALKVAVQEGKLGSSPAERMEAPSTETAKRQTFTADQARRVLAATDNARWWLALFYGMRQGEVLGLRWCDVDFDRHLLRIEQSLQTDMDGALIFGPPKSRASKRPLPLLPIMEARLKLLWIAAGEPGPDSTELILNVDGKPIRPRDDWQAWVDLLESIGTEEEPLPRIALHAARNSAASLMEAAGVPDRVVAQILGHSQVQITHGYQVAEVERLRAALTQVDDFLALPAGD